MDAVDLDDVVEFERPRRFKPVFDAVRSYAKFKRRKRRAIDAYMTFPLLEHHSRRDVAFAAKRDEVGRFFSVYKTCDRL